MLISLFLNHCYSGLNSTLKLYLVSEDYNPRIESTHDISTVDLEGVSVNFSSAVSYLPSGGVRSESALVLKKLVIPSIILTFSEPLNGRIESLQLGANISDSVLPGGQARCVRND